MNKLIIKGTLASMDHPAFFGIWFFRLIALSLLCVFILALFLFRELPKYLENRTIDKWALYSLLIILVCAGFAYFMATTHYYYYEFHKDALVVRNWFKKYRYEFPYRNIILVNFGWPPLKWNHYRTEIEIIYHEQGVKNSKEYASHSLSRSDWETFIKMLEELQVPYGDPTGKFFQDKP